MITRKWKLEPGRLIQNVDLGVCSGSEAWLCAVGGESVRFGQNETKQPDNGDRYNDRKQLEDGKFGHVTFPLDCKGRDRKLHVVYNV